MNLLKYLDVLIGLAIVMILLSPAVTGITQLVIGVLRLRPSALGAGIRDLLLQLGSTRLSEFAWAEFRAPGGTPILIEGLPPSRTDATGVAVIEGPVPVRGNALQFKTTAGAQFAVTLIPRASLTHDVDTDPTDGNGSTRLSYVRPPIAPTAADVTVVDNSGAAIDAAITWKEANVSRSANVMRGAPFTLQLPSGALIDPQQPFELSVTDTSVPPKPIVGCRARFAFRRNTTFDRTLPPATAGPNGVVSIPLEADLTASFSVDDAAKLADCVLLHPMIATPRSTLAQRLRLDAYAKGTVVEREELIRILLEFAASEGAGANVVKDDAVRQTLRRVLERNGISDPARTLADIRMRAQELEHSQPELAAHVRQTMAIIEKAKGDFVGKIHNWFDQVMQRVTNRYTFWARIVTVGSAFVVAVALQFDSADLIRRLSIDDGLRDSLLKQAQAYDDRITKAQSTSAPQADAAVDRQQVLDSAKAQLASIDENLATLRNGQLSILPQRLPFQAPPPRSRARLALNENWNEPFRTQFELVLGRSSYKVRPDWREMIRGASGAPASLLEVFQRAIERSAAPVDVFIDKSSDSELVVTGDGSDDLVLVADKQSTTLLRGEDEVLRARVFLSHLGDGLRFENEPSEQKPITVKWQFVVGDRTPAVALPVASRDNVMKQLQAAVPPGVEAKPFPCPPKPAEPALKKAVSSQPTSADAPPCAPGELGLALIATDRQANFLALRAKENAPDTDMLNRVVERVPRRARVTRSTLARYIAAKKPATLFIGQIELCGVRQDCGEPNLEQIRQKINAAGGTMRALVRPLDHLVLTSRVGGDIQLRYAAGDAASNILNRYIERVPADAVPQAPLWPLRSPRWPPPWGLVLTWILLSLGAPFWYEMLKDTLKLRPALAQREEQQRRDRQDDTTKGGTQTASGK